MIVYQDVPEPDVPDGKCPVNETCNCTRKDVEITDYRTEKTKTYDKCVCDCCYRVSQEGTNINCPILDEEKCEYTTELSVDPDLWSLNGTNNVFQIIPDDPSLRLEGGSRALVVASEKSDTGL